MAGSEAQSAASGSPPARVSSSWRRIIEVRIPRRRWVGSTPTTVTPAVGTMAPGTVISNGNDPAPATIALPSVATSIRSTGRNLEKRSESSSEGSQPKK